MVPLVLAVVASATLNVHLGLTDSVAQNLQNGTISKIVVSAANGTSRSSTVSVNTTTPTATLNVPQPGKWTIRTLLMVNGEYYVVKPDGTEVTIVPGPQDVNVPVAANMVAGTVTNHGAPVRGQMNVWPMEHKKGNWGFAVPFDQNGHFLFPLPQEGDGKWDLTISSSPRDVLAKIDNFEFQPDNAIDIANSAPAKLDVRLNLSDSVTQSLHDGTLSAVRVLAVGDAGQRETLRAGAPAVMAAGKWKLYPLIAAPKYTFLLDREGKEVALAAGQAVEVSIDVPSIIYTGTAKFRGAPLTGTLNIVPSATQPGINFGFATPLDEQGRFIVPLPHEGKWNLTFSSEQQHVLAKMPDVNFGDARQMTIDVPEAAAEIAPAR